MRPNRSFQENIIYIMISVAINLATPTIAPAQVGSYNPINFTVPLNVSRGKIMPANTESQRLDNEDACRLVTEKWGWSKSSCPEIDAFIMRHLTGIDTLIVTKPNSEGFVKFDDWGTSEAKDEISGIWDELVTGSKAQSQRAGVEIIPLKWIVYPHLDKAKSFMYYAYLMRWGDSHVVNIKLSKFDRRGYVEFSIVPDKQDYTSSQLNQIVDKLLASYIPATNESYFDTQSGDKIAAVGAVGVLASLMGVKYGKTAFAGFLALAAIFLKKAWFLLLLPLFFLKKLFSRKAVSETVATTSTENELKPSNPIGHNDVRYCEACGTPSSINSFFCPKCGVKKPV